MGTANIDLPMANHVTSLSGFSDRMSGFEKEGKAVEFWGFGVDWFGVLGGHVGFFGFGFLCLRWRVFLVWDFLFCLFGFFSFLLGDFLVVLGLVFFTLNLARSSA